MYDCHAHLAIDAFDGDRLEVIENARKAGITTIVVVSEDLEDSRRTLEVCRDDPTLLHPCIGLHPDRFAEEKPTPTAADIDAVCRLARQHRNEIAAIGEVGLDYWRVKTAQNRALQRQCLEHMARLARELDLPLNVHARSAGRHTLELLAAVGAPKVLMHAFDGKAGHARDAAERQGWIFSIPPSVVRSTQKQRLVRVLPLESMALESDSPVLGPEPGRRNEPANIRHTLRYIARAKNVSEEKVALITTRNAQTLFSITPYVA